MHSHEVWIPIIFSISFAVVVIAFFYLSHKNKLALQQTVQKSIDAGNQLTPELIEKLGVQQSPRVRDLRRGVVLTAMGLAIIAGGALAADADDMSGVIAIGFFPMFIGAALLLVWKMNRYAD